MSTDNSGTTTRSDARPRTIYLMNQVNQAIRNALDLRLRAFKVTGLQYTILTVVRSHTGISSAELSRRFFVTPQTMNETVTAMERRGLLVRREQADNRRILVAYLTDEGEALLRQCDAIADEIDREAFGDMSDADFDALRRLLRGRLRAQRERGEQDKG